MKVLITGATGFVGTEVVRQLRDSSCGVHCLVRNPRSQSAQKLAKDFSAELCQGDITNASSLKAALREMDAIIQQIGFEEGIARYLKTKG